MIKIIPSRSSAHLGAMDLLMAFLSLLLVFGALFNLTIGKDTELKQVVLLFDTLVCSLMLLHWVWEFVRSTHKRQYVKSRWIDLLASIPLVEAARVLRLLQIWRVIQVIRKSRNVLSQLDDEPVELIAAIAILTVLTVLCISTLVMTLVEIPNPDSPFQTTGDIFWWSVVTLSTVGYGDLVPHSAAGRAVASLVIFTGVGLFGALSAFTASLVFQPQQANREAELNRRLHQVEQDQQRLLQQNERLLSKVEAIQQQLGEPPR